VRSSISDDHHRAGPFDAAGRAARARRTEIPEYADIEQEIGAAAGRINGAYGEVDWTPIRYINRAFSHSTLAGLYRAAGVGLVTPLRDGMNLVAKEYVASQNSDDPGVLILSRKRAMTPSILAVISRETAACTATTSISSSPIGQCGSTCFRSA
jgi:hypothetical protein